MAIACYYLNKTSFLLLFADIYHLFASIRYEEWLTELVLAKVFDEEWLTEPVLVKFYYYFLSIR